MLMSESSSFSTQRLSWDSSSNTPSMFSTSQANQTYKHDNYKSITTESSIKTLLHLRYWCFEYTCLCTEGLALDKRGCCISRNPVNQGREETMVSMVTQGILYENGKQHKIVIFFSYKFPCEENKTKQTGIYKTVYYLPGQHQCDVWLIKYASLPNRVKGPCSTKDFAFEIVTHLIFIKITEEIFLIINKLLLQYH